ncbi:MAG: 2-dehydro-3-deoxyglucarate aldolase [Candidatus Latescibacteria bacterium]|nr:2-dehydro-3-deoxyglucarate aldolase [Candidatus Latescibacterota bacterium]
MRQVRRNRTKEKLAAGKTVVGTWLNLASPVAAEHLAHVGFDFLVVDAEHSPIGLNSVFQCLQGIAGGEATPMARVAWNDPMVIKQVFEAGAWGVVVPMVNSADEAVQAVRAMRFPPDGARSMGALASAYGPDYGARANAEILAVVMVEHIDAIGRAADIVTVPGVDVVFIGTGDLALSMGVPIGHPEHEAAVQAVLRAGQAAGTPVGLPCRSAEDVNTRAAQGFRFIDLSSDFRMLMAAATEALGKIVKSDE